MAIGRLPNLLVAGVPKAGTGSLFAYLSQHPDICAADTKEVGYLNFYDPSRHTGPPPPLEVYRRHFAHCAHQRYAFEATPTYSYGGRPIIDAVRTVLGPAKVIISLRDPVARLWSAYTFQRELGNLTEFGSFQDYVEACERRRRAGSQPVPRDHMHGLHIGFYADYVPLWLNTLGEDVKVIFAEQLFADPAAVLGSLFRWLGIDEAAVSAMNLVPRNSTQHPRSVRVAKLAYRLKRSGEQLRLLPPGVRTPLRRLYAATNAGRAPNRMAPEVRRHVAGLYQQSNVELASTLTAHDYHDLPAWLQTGADVIDYESA